MSKRRLPVERIHPLTERETFWETRACRDLDGKPHRFGREKDLGIGDNRCLGCDRTAAMMDGPNQ